MGRGAKSQVICRLRSEGEVNASKWCISHCSSLLYWLVNRKFLCKGIICSLTCSSVYLKVDGIRNPRIQSIYLESFPIYKACFSVDGEQVIATGTHHKLFFVYDMMSGSITPIQKVRGTSYSAINVWALLKLSSVQSI